MKMVSKLLNHPSGCVLKGPRPRPGPPQMVQRPDPGPGPAPIVGPGHGLNFSFRSPMSCSFMVALRAQDSRTVLVGYCHGCAHWQIPRSCKLPNFRARALSQLLFQKPHAMHAAPPCALELRARDRTPVVLPTGEAQHVYFPVRTYIYICMKSYTKT